MIIIRNLDEIYQGDYQDEISLTVERRVLAKRRWRGQADWMVPTSALIWYRLFEMEFVFIRRKIEIM